ncbi:response regulator transcription factor [Paenibacillus sp. DMB20]|uniref:response regulator transcription factor n=1 Tax=Paenibacillus sp. DMB20 TaxID=1642570 RepID=UPI0006281204|nr:response regulator [Paenibacillus sp. DMB20]KKO51467.1 AraC family transcriptional regulator [Paenibacillus sp. DMB20]
MKALIVDDEKHVRDAIRLLANWERFGITDVYEAADGEEAVEMILAFSPQIVMTDMRMPRKDGAGLMTWLHKFSPETKVLVISGYDDFEFVRHAIRHGGMDYILKPVNPEALNEALEKASQAWRKDEENRLRQTTQSIEVNQMTPLYLDRLLTDLITGGAGREQLLIQLRERLSIPVGIEACSAAAVSEFQFDRELLSKFLNRKGLLAFTLINICSEVLRDQGAAFRHMDKPGLIMILYWGTVPSFHSVLEEINRGIYATLRRRAHFGTAHAVRFPDDLHRASWEAEQVLLCRNLLEEKLYIHTGRCVESGTSRPLRLSSHEENFRLAALSGSNEKIEAAADEWLEEVKRRGPVSPENLIRWSSEWDWMQHLWAEPEGTEGQAPEEDAEISRDIHVALPLNEEGLLSWEGWKQQIAGRIHAASRVLAQAHSRENHIIHDIARYLKQSYHQEISLQDIASRFFLSREYISRKFRQEFGVTLSDFLGRIRIDKAKLLLLNPNLRIAQVAEMVGYQDEKYFSKVFKKLEGQTPNDYRKEKTV